MGLDMYIFEIDKNNVTWSDLVDLEELAYWRKANQVHRWFVENIQNNVDNCEPHPVTKEELKILLSLCEEILDDYTKAPELLPTTSGFFFGSTSYDDWYFDDIRRTVDQLNKILNMDTKQLYYVTSW